MAQRIILATLDIWRRGGVTEVTCRIACHKDTHLSGGSPLQLTALNDQDSITTHPISGSIIDRTDGITMARLLIRHLSLEDVLARLGRMPNVSDVKVIRQ